MGSHPWTPGLRPRVSAAGVRHRGGERHRGSDQGKHGRDLKRVSADCDA